MFSNTSTKSSTNTSTCSCIASSSKKNSKPQHLSTLIASESTPCCCAHDHTNTNTSTHTNTNTNTKRGVLDTSNDHYSHVRGKRRIDSYAISVSSPVSSSVSASKSKYRSYKQKRYNAVILLSSRRKGWNSFLSLSSLCTFLLLHLLCYQGYAFTNLSTSRTLLVQQLNHNPVTTTTTTTAATTTTSTNSRYTNKSHVLLYARTAQDDKTIQAVKPLKASTREKRMSVQRAWDEAQQMIDSMEQNAIQNNNDTNDNGNGNGRDASRTSNSSSIHNNDDDYTSSSSSSSSATSTPFLDLFTDAGIARVRKVPTSSSSLKDNAKNVKSKGRPSSVPGAMSRTTLMNLNEMESRGRRPTGSIRTNNHNIPQSDPQIPRSNKQQDSQRDTLNRIYSASSGSSYTPSSSTSTSTSSSTSTTADQKVYNSVISSSSSSSPTQQTPSSALNSIPKKKKRGRGRPRKEPSSDTSIDEMTSIAASMSISEKQKSKTKSKDSISLKQKSSNVANSSTKGNHHHHHQSKRSENMNMEKKIKSRTNKNIESKSSPSSSSSSSSSSSPSKTAKMTIPRKSKRVLKTLRPKTKTAKQLLKESKQQKQQLLLKEEHNNNNKENNNETTGMMQTFKKGKDGNEPPNLQKYYRTELLTPQEEYTIGMKIQFMIGCELVYEGLVERLDHVPTIEEWANACGFVEIDDYSSSLEFLESDYVNQIRPLKNESIDPIEDGNMFVGNGLVHAKGPGRGRGRAKKAPPMKLKDYYDDSDTKFDESKKKEQKLKPINRGTTSDFVDLMVNAKMAKQRMVQCNMRLVVSISKRYKHVGVNIADLVQEGSIGLTRAAEKFDPKKGFKFSTYASWWIQQAVFRSIAYHSRTIRLPVHVHNLLNRVRRVRLELQRILGRTPTNEEMASELDMTLAKYNKMIRLTRKAISLDMAKYQNNPKDIGQESETSLGDTIDASEVIRDESSPEQSVDRVLFRDDLIEMLKILGDDERAVIYSRYGIEDGLTRTVTTVAAQMGQTKSWVRSQECRALRKLRRPWYEKRLWEHQNSLTG